MNISISYLHLSDSSFIGSFIILFAFVTFFNNYYKLFFNPLTISISLPTLISFLINCSPVKDNYSNYKDINSYYLSTI